MKIRLILAINLAAILASTFMVGQTNIETFARDTSQALVKGHIAWKTKLSSPGASISAKEVGREGSAVAYNLYVSGLPSNGLYRVMSWPITENQPITLFKGVSLRKDGLVVCGGRTPDQCGDASAKDDPIDFEVSTIKGEPSRLALVAGNDRAAIVIVANPIATEERGCVLEIERLLPRFQLAYITGAGFPPDRKVTFKTQSYDEKHTITTTTDTDGNLKFAMMPAVTGHPKGMTTIKSDEMKCPLSISFEWGTE